MDESLGFTGGQPNNEESREYASENPAEQQHQQHYSSENYKVEIFGLPKHIGYGQLKRVLTHNLKLNVKKISITQNRQMKFVFVTLADESSRTDALHKINNYILKGHTLTAKKAKPKPDPIRNKKFDEDEESPDKKRPKLLITEETVQQRLLAQTTPLYDIPYPEQLESKHNDILEFCKDLNSEIQKSNPQFSQTLDSLSKESSHGFPWKLETILPSPETMGYRNKCEFTCGYQTLGRSGGKQDGITSELDEAKTKQDETITEPDQPQTEQVETEIKQDEPESKHDNTEASHAKEASVEDDGKDVGGDDVGSVQGTTQVESDRCSGPLKQVGFRLGTYKDGSLSVESVSKCVHVSEKMKSVVQDMLTYVRSREGVECYDPRDHSGFYHTLTVRTNRSDGEVMVILDLWCEGVTQKDIDVEIGKLRAFMETKVTSLYVRLKKMRKSGGDGPSLLHISGEKFIEEEVLGCRFRISPDAFFQVNTAAAEVLYSQIPSCCSFDSEKTVLLDICCGTGTIGQTMAKFVHKVVGIELSKDSVEDAKFNATVNNLTSKCEYICGRAEDVIGGVLKRSPPPAEVVAVVDPPRSGLGKKLILALRRHPGINTLIYVSCNARAAKPNFKMLCQRESNVVNGEAFVPTNMIPVDLFPHTKLYELIIVFKRVSNLQPLSTDIQE